MPILRKDTSAFSEYNEKVEENEDKFLTEEKKEIFQSGGQNSSFSMLGDKNLHSNDRKI